MTVFQVLAAIFALAMIYVVIIHGKKKTLSVAEMAIWIAIWVLFIVIAIFPDVLMGLVTALHFGRVFDLLVVAALMILTVLVFASYFTYKETKQKLDTLIRQMAIEDTKSQRER